MPEASCCPGACACCGGNLGRSYHWTNNATYCKRCHAEIVRLGGKTPPRQLALELGPVVKPQRAPAREPEPEVWGDHVY